MSKRLLLIALVAIGAFAAGAYLRPGGFVRTSAPAPAGPVHQEAPPPQLVCTGMVESVDGEIDVFAQLPGELTEVRVREGDTIQKGQVLAVVDARRSEAEVAVAQATVALAQAKLKRVQAGVGDEEKQEVLLAIESADALSKYATANRDRLRKLHNEKSISLDEVQRSESEVQHLQKQMASLKKRHDALCRGPIPEEVALARAEIAQADQRLRQAMVNYEYRTVHAPVSGAVVHVYRHTGDSVSAEQVTPILRIVDAARLRIRLEIDEVDAPRLGSLREGVFQVRGVSQDAGRLVIKTVVPQFGPKRLFNPDTSARMDTRTLSVLCDIATSSVPLYPGQRITAHIRLEPTVRPTTTAQRAPDSDRAPRVE